MPPLNVLHVTPYSAGAWAYGGIPRLAGVFARELARAGHLVTVCATDACTTDRRLGREDGGRPWQPWPPRRTADGVELRVFPNVSNRLAHDAQLFLPLGLRQFLRTHAARFDIAHLHACRNLPGVLAARALVRAEVPYLVAPNGTAPRLERRLAAKRLFDWTVGQRVIDQAAGILAVSHAEIGQLAALGVPAGSIRLLPNPVDLEEFRNEVPRGRFRARHGLGTTPLVLFLGKITPRKRVDVLIRAFASLSRPDATLVVAGNDMGAGRQARRLAIALNLDRRVRFTGLITGRERLEALADADVVVYPSEHEIFGLVPLEALLCGTPVVVADDSGCGEIIGRLSQRVFPAGSAPALARAIDEILHAPDRSRAAAADAARRVRSTYDAERVTRQLADIYLDVLERRRVAA